MLEVLEEHVLGAAQPDALGAHFAGHARVLRRIRIGAHADFPVLVGPLHQRVVSLRRLGTHQLDLPAIHRAIAAIERDPVAFPHHVPVDAHLLGFRIDVDLLRADDAALAPAARDHRRVAGLAAGRGENALRHVHAAHVFRAGFAPDQDHFLALRGPLFGFLRGEYSLARPPPRHRIDPAGNLPAWPVRCGQALGSSTG